MTASEWEDFFDKCIKRVAREKMILDIGSGHPFQKEMKEYKELFDRSGCRYYALDREAEFNPDVIANAHMLPFKSDSVDAIICKAVLEHTSRPLNVVNEIYRVLKKRGKVFAMSLSYIPIMAPKPMKITIDLRGMESSICLGSLKRLKWLRLEGI